jgi:hypothetical protein
MKKRVSLEAQDATIRDMAARGRMLPEIAEATGGAVGSIGQYLRRNGIPYTPDRSLRKRRQGACDRHHEVVVAMAEAGATLDAIGNAIGTTKNRVRSYLTRMGIERPAWREADPDSHPMSRRTGGALNPAWRGGRSLDKDGYVLLWMPGHPEANIHNQVREHRIVMARMIGRPLLRTEVVHHRNDIRDDNRPENLELFDSNGEHLSVTLTGQKSRASRGLPPSTRGSSSRGDRR